VAQHRLFFLMKLHKVQKRGLVLVDALLQDDELRINFIYVLLTRLLFRGWGHIGREQGHGTGRHVFGA
jgi:hypothetical protein